MNPSKVIISVFALLILIIGISVYSCRALNISSNNLEKYIVQIEENAKSGDWQQARNNILNVKNYWSKTQKTWSMLLDHMEIDNIDITLSRLDKYVDTEDTSSALAEVAALKQYIKHIPEKEALRIKNIL